MTIDNEQENENETGKQQEPNGMLLDDSSTSTGTTSTTTATKDTPYAAGIATTTSSTTVNTTCENNAKEEEKENKVKEEEVEENGADGNNTDNHTNHTVSNDKDNEDEQYQQQHQHQQQPIAMDIDDGCNTTETSTTQTAAAETISSSTTPPPPKSSSESILLKGDDDEDEDEEEDAYEEEEELVEEQQQQQQTTMDGILHSSQQGENMNTNTNTTNTILYNNTPHLIPQIITPSPFAHHNDNASPSSDRYRSALQRVQNAPLTDVEAWQVIMNECTSLYRTQILPSLEEERETNRMLASVSSIHRNTLTTHSSSSSSMEIESKLNWVESCHGHLLRYFPYCGNYYVSVCEELMARSALPFESLTGKTEAEIHAGMGTGMGMGIDNGLEEIALHAFVPQTQGRLACETKMERIFRLALGVNMDGTTIDHDEEEFCNNYIKHHHPSQQQQQQQQQQHNDDKDEENPNNNSPRYEHAQMQVMPILGGMCTSSIDLWLLYVRKRSRDARRTALKMHPSPSLLHYLTHQHHHLQNDPNTAGIPTPPPPPLPPSSSTSPITTEGETLIREWITQAYETALSHGAAFVTNNHLLWKQYLQFVKSWLNIPATTIAPPPTLLPNGQPDPSSQPPPTPTIDPALVASQKSHLRNLYQRIVALPMTGLDGLWIEYEQFEKSQSEQLASALIAEHMPRYQHARQVYLERNRVYTVQDLRVGRLATPPVDLEYVRGSSFAMGMGLVDDDDDEEDEDGGNAELESRRVRRDMASSNATNNVVTTGGVGISASNGKNMHPSSITSSSNDASNPNCVLNEIGSSSERFVTITSSNREEYDSKMREESMVLCKWKRRCGYERTNPERLSSTDLAIRIRQAYKDAICAFMRHIEVWHEWSTWELYNSASSGRTNLPPEWTEKGFLKGATAAGKRRNVIMSLAVLELGQRHIPDSTFLGYAKTQLFESLVPSSSSSSSSAATTSLSYLSLSSTLSSSTTPTSLLGGGNNHPKKNEKGEDPATAAIRTMVDFCDRAGNTLSYVLLQQLVRKYRGIREARAVFSKARRDLRIKEDDVLAAVSGGGKMGHNLDSSPANGDIIAQQSSAGVATATIKSASSVSTGNHTLSTMGNSIQQHMVINRNTRDPRAKMMQQQQHLKNIQNYSGANMNGNGNGGGMTPPPSYSQSKSKVRKGFITWHLYAAHATMEHRMNRSPHVAARVYELGLKKHRTFLSTPPYVLQYAELLLELNDEKNLRALLTRAIAACEEENILDDVILGSTGNPANAVTGSNNSTASAISAKREMQRPLWDTMLKFEAILSSRSGDYSTLQSIEERKRRALYGPNNEDVSGGNFVNGESDVGIGVHKTNLNDVLIRNDGYDASSRIANGLNRLVDTLETVGILDGNTNRNSTSPTSLGSILTPASVSSLSEGCSIWKDDGAGGLSDASFRRRSRYQIESKALASLPLSVGMGGVTGAMAGDGTVGGTVPATAGKFLSAKERYMAQSAAQTAAAAVQSSPSWLKELVVLLPLSRNIRGAKAPPHMIEMAIAALRDRTLPAERPVDEKDTEAKSSSTASGNGGVDNGGNDTGNNVNNNASLDNSTLKRKRGDMGDNGGDSSDEEDMATFGGGYGAQFRARQQARMMGVSLEVENANGSATNVSAGSTLAMGPAQ